MKGWIKGMLIVSATCVTTGAVLGGVAWAMGGRFSQFRHQSYGLVVQEARDNTDIPVSEERPPEPQRTETPQPELTEAQPQNSVSEMPPQPERGSGAASGGGRLEYEGRLVSELDINVEGVNVEVIADDSADRIQIICDDEDFRCDQEMDEDTLEIHVRKRRNKDWSFLETMDQWEEIAAQIIIPANVLFDEVDLEVAGGILTVDQISANKLSLEVQGGKLEVLSGRAGQLKGECQAGELVYEGQAWWEMEAECQAGAIRYLIEGREEDFNYEIDTSLGKITISGTGVEELRKETILTNPGATKRAELECEAGAIEIDFYQP